MKIKKMVIVYTILMAGFFFLLVRPWGTKETELHNMVYYNEQKIRIEQEIAQGKALADIEREYGCEIFFVTEDNYNIYLNQALQKEALILDYMEGEKLTGKIVWSQREIRYQKLEKELLYKGICVWVLLLAGGYLLFLYLYLQFLRPFHTLEQFARQISKGNLEFPLPIKKRNFFGAFTESFDIMREELKRARESEYQANRSKKELVAELSHDIKTPISTIQATCEVLEVKEKNQDTLAKVAVIAAKAKMIDELVGNLFHAALEELAVLKVETVEESSLVLEEMFQGLNFYDNLVMGNSVPPCLVFMDKLRLQQVIDNIINNSWKYSGTEIVVTFVEEEGGILIKIKDHGNGVNPEELPLLQEKFYRGSNARGKSGTGLGLYLAGMFMKQMQGGMEYYNEKGFVVELFLRKV